MVIRKANKNDIGKIERIYDRIHDLEESGKQTIGWIRGVYPVRKTAEDALARGDLFVMEEQENVVAAAVINRIQVPAYANAAWRCPAGENDVMVLHTLTVDPAASGKGFGTAFVRFYEAYALENGCRELRMDTNAKNRTARAMYRNMGYTEADIIPCTFNGIPGVMLVCLEKTLTPA